MSMRRAGLLFVVLIAAAIAFEPLIHTHPLSQTSGSPCAVCVSTAGRVTPLTPAPIAPLFAVSVVAVFVASATIRRAYQPLASRAPPAA